MKITEELWNENAYGIEWLKGPNNYLNTINYFFNIMRKITKRVVLRASITEKPTTNEGYKKYTEFLLGEEFLKKYDLTPAFNCVVSKSDGDWYCSSYNLAGYKEFKHNLSKEIAPQDIKTLPLMLFGDNIVISLSAETECDNDDFIYQVGLTIEDIYYTSDKVDVVKEILMSIYEINKQLPNLPNEREGQIKLGFAYRLADGKIETFNKFVKIKDIQLDQFNDSLPHKKIINILNKDEAGLVLLHGEPGCGKSSYIKYLVKECSNKFFIIVSQDLLQSMDSFREFLLRLSSEDAVIVIEDCENLVKSRESVGSNIIISDFLNITDGIYGDLFRLKFILTFNTDVKTIDQALLRRGRLKCKYKFNKLKGEKLKKMAEKLGISLNEQQMEKGVSLADLFNYDEDNGSGVQKEVVRIGFNK